MKKILLILLLITSFSNAQQLAFPSAKGAGAYATGGAGGQIIHVTTLNWDGAGSLKAAIQTPGPRTIVFDVSGEIDATSEGNFSTIINGSSYDDLTIAGQTAPAGGITVKTSFFRFNDVDNIIMRYIRFRRTLDATLFNGNGYTSSAIWFRRCSNVIVDHVTTSHGTQKAFDFSSSDGVSGDITVQNCFFQDSANGMIMGADTSAEGTVLPDLGDFTVINNVWSNISHRFINPQGNGHYDFINNYIYNWRARLARITQEGTYNFVNNYYKGSVNGIHRSGWFTEYNITDDYMNKVQTQSYDDPLIYASGSVIYIQRETPKTDDSDMWSVFDGSHLTVNSSVPSQYFTSTQFPIVGEAYTIKTAQQTAIDVLTDVGANKRLNDDGSISDNRDSKDIADIIMIENDSYDGAWYDQNNRPHPVIASNTRLASAYSTNAHIPEAYFTAKGITGNSNIHNVTQASGYTLMREYLNEIDGSIVVVGVESVSVTPSTSNLSKGQTLQLNEQFTPVNASNKTGVWSTTNANVATVNQSGLVTGLQPGTTTITFASNDDGNITSSAVITVLADAIGNISFTDRIILIIR